MSDYLAFQADLSSPETVSTYDELPLWSAMSGLLLLRHVPLRQHITVLDVGCGTGFPLFELAQRLGSTSRVYGIDPWEAALRRASLKARTWDIRNTALSLAKAEAMPFPDNRFDLIVCNLGLNFADPDAALAECWRVARPSARLVLTTNLRGHMGEFYEVFEATLRHLGQQYALEGLRSHVAHRATLDRLQEQLERAGFRLTGVHEETASMRFIDGSALLHHHFIKLAFLDGWKRVLDERDRGTVFAHLEASLNRLAEARGELALTVPIAYVEAEKVT
jgi:arsenite methyltransferase